VGRSFRSEIKVCAQRVPLSRANRVAFPTPFAPAVSFRFCLCRCRYAVILSAAKNLTRSKVAAIKSRAHFAAKGR